MRLFAADPAMRFLVACARRELDEREARAALQEGVDWDRVLVLAEMHGLHPLLFRHLQADFPSIIPQHVLALLWARHSALVRRNDALARLLRSTLEAFAAAGIEAVPYKGPSLAIEAYDDLYLREFGDLDILLQRSQVRPAIAQLQGQGFALDYDLQPSALDSLLDSPAQYHVAMRRDKNQLIELHWKTDPDFVVERMDRREWWDRLVSIPLAGATVPGLPDDELFLVLCLHGSKHFWSSLGWLVDIAELMRRKPLAWAPLIGKAEELQASRRFALGLEMARRLLDARIPPELEDWLRLHPVAHSVADELSASLGAGGNPQQWSPWRRLRMNLLLYETTGQRIRHLADVVFRPGIADWSFVSTSSRKAWVYYPIRWYRLLLKHVFKRDSAA